MTQTSEWVSPGHPDRTTDYITSYLLDRYLERDPKTRYAVEVQLKDNFATLGGEVTSKAAFTDEEIAAHVRNAIREVGYTHAYASRWPEGATLDADRVDVAVHLSRQSPDIAQGVDADGWGDQGIFWGMATGTAETGFMPLDHTVAKRLGTWLYNSARNGRLPIGLDIKTQVTVEDGRVKRVVVAAPTRTEAEAAALRAPILEWLVGECSDPFAVDPDDLVVNGTGAYVRHASMGDCGTTGRKLAVDFYGGNCRIGGGSPWSKDATKADVTLNVYARHLALEMREKCGAETVYCAIDCCIGRREIGIVYLDGHLDEIGRASQSLPAREVIAMMGLDRPVFAAKCRDGLFA